jgi:ElaB/YqjD/DUF883 family membrane-anchored ribosome-binding protein
VAGALDEAREKASETAARAGEKLSDLQERVSGYADTMRRSAHEAMDTIADSASAARERVQENVGAARERVQENVSAAREALRRRDIPSAQGLVGFVREQPLIAVGIGIALGAAIGALFPVSEAERHWIGGGAERLRRTASDELDKQVATMRETVREAARDTSLAAGPLRDEPGATAAKL